MENKYSFEENPNPDAKIAFVMWTPFDFYVYKNVVKYLPESEFVICNTWFKSLKKGGGKYIEDSVNLLKRHRAYWRIVYHIRLHDLLESKIIEDFFKKYEVVVGLRLWPPLASPLFDNWLFKKKSVLMNYGAGKDLITFAPWTARFDIALSDGPHVHHYLNLLTNSYVVGVPKYDDWFNQAVDRPEVDQIRGRLDGNKRTVLYLPTHSALSSLHKFADAVCALTKKYNVLVKFHYLNAYTERDIVEKIKRNSAIFCFDERDDILPLFFVADAVLSDSSSASLEALLVDKPLVILDMEKDENNLTEEDEFNGLWYSFGQVYSKSIEQQIKKPEMKVGEVVQKPEDLEEVLEKLFISKSKFLENRKKLRDELFSYNDGKCGERAAAVIRKYLNDEIRPEPPLLGMAMRAYFSSKGKEYQLKLLKKDREIEKLREIIRKDKN